MLNEESKTQTSHNGPVDDDPICHLLYGLKRVDAPGDFEFRVKAGIAERRANSGRYSWLPSGLKIAVPAALLLTVGGYVGIGSLYDPAGGQATVSQALPVEAAPAGEIPAAIQRPVEPDLAINANQFVALNASPKPTEAVNRLAANALEKRIPSRTMTNGSGSYDEAIRESQLIPLVKTNPNGNTPNAGKVSVSGVFQTMGISATASTAGWIVGSVSGRAQQAGVRPGDVIEAVNGQPLGSGTSFNSPFRASTLRIRRNGKAIQISLR